jgi:hypothetical protein
MPYPEKKERNEMVFHLISCGHTFAEVGELYHIHPTRVLQIYNAMFRKKFSSLDLIYKEAKTNG